MGMNALAMGWAPGWGLMVYGVLGTVLWLVLALAEVAQGAPPQGISRTAFSTLAYRAIAAQDPDPATRNPDDLAARLCNPTIIYDRMGLSLVFDKAIQEIEKRKRFLFYYVNARTKYMDQTLSQALAQGVQQVVLLGAGFDTRAHRFHAGHPQVRFFEVDLPVMVKIKQKLVGMRLCSSPPSLRYVPIDFETQQLAREMERAGFKRDMKTVFLWEGVAMYLDAGAVSATLGYIAANSAPGSSVAFDYVLPQVVERGLKRANPDDQVMAQRLRKIGEPLKWGIEHEKLGAFLEGLGMSLKSNLGPEEITKLYQTGSNGQPLGRLPRGSWFALAEVPQPKAPDL